ncbi:MAG TPA: hypothetical protein VFA70_07680, partial [Dehalococcoidia bacterium]|nr:hypothetical protein [Dehalococcoidia bacterium]
QILSEKRAVICKCRGNFGLGLHEKAFLPVVADFDFLKMEMTGWRACPTQLVKHRPKSSDGRDTCPGQGPARCRVSGAPVP